MNKAFTFLEGLLVTAILGLIFTLSTVAFVRFQRTYDLRNAANELLQNLKRAQAKAIAQENDTNWGIKFDLENKKYFLCQENNCVNNFGEEFSYPAGLIIDIDPETNPIIFQKLSGNISSEVIIELTTDSQNKNIRITGSGLISLE